MSFVICPPCAAVDHAHCIGAVVWCECWTEILLEVEEMTDE